MNHETSLHQKETLPPIIPSKKMKKSSLASSDFEKLNEGRRRKKASSALDNYSLTVNHDYPDVESLINSYRRRSPDTRIDTLQV